MFLLIFAFLCFALAVFGFIGMKKKQKKSQAPHVPQKRIITEFVYLKDIENADRFFRGLKDELAENDEYDRPARELKEDYDHEKVYRYIPECLDYRIEDRQVYAMLDGAEYHVGRIKKGAEVPPGSVLCFYPNVYKYVTEDDVSEESGDHYFGFEIKKEVGI